MSTEAVIRPSVSEDAVLELLTGASLDRAQALVLLGEGGQEQPDLSTHPDEEQSSSRSVVAHRDQRSTSRAPEAAPFVESGQGTCERSAFESSVLATLEAMGRRLDELASRVDGPNETSERATPRSSSRLGESLVMDTQEPPRRLWADVPIDEVPDYAAPLTWEDDNEGDSSRLLDVSEGTKKAIVQAFGKPMGNQTRLQTWRPYPFPAVTETKCPKLDPVAK